MSAEGDVRRRPLAKSSPRVRTTVGGNMSVPSWLPVSFEKAVTGLGATASSAEIQETCTSVLARWSEPDRIFHDIHHLTAMLANVEKLINETHHPDTVRLAAWYHGVVFSTSRYRVYTKRGGEDELLSARTAENELTHLGIAPETARRVAELIWGMKAPALTAMPVMGRAPATSLGTAEQDIDIMVLRDAHLAILASSPQSYRRYTQAIREEYPHIPDESFWRGREKIVAKLLERKHLFYTPEGQKWEDAARQNLQAEAAKLRKRLAEPEPGTGGANAAGGPHPVDTAHAADGANAAKALRPVDTAGTAEGVQTVNTARSVDVTRPAEVTRPGDTNVGTTTLTGLSTPSAPTTPAGADAYRDARTETSTLEAVEARIPEEDAGEVTRVLPTGPAAEASEPQLSAEQLRKRQREEVSQATLNKINARRRAAEKERDEAIALAENIDSPLADRAQAEVWKEKEREGAPRRTPRYTESIPPLIEDDPEGDIVGRPADPSPTHGIEREPDM
ncbi:HD domain-containing protein [Actinotignum schaalii]|uniref:HD domain-containing protein n=1 Tax=Actinotignum schaalii TaxID=59505 RepID=UPI0011DE38D2|nr:hypothetical protein [Actinotignum schaalii]WQN44811.1 hypothetical protein U4A90_07390 [Actinotignum schaalii]